MDERIRNRHRPVVEMTMPAPEVILDLTPELRTGIAAQLRMIADLIDPPVAERAVERNP